MVLNWPFPLLLKHLQSFTEFDILRVRVDEMAIDTQGFLCKTLP